MADEYQRSAAGTNLVPENPLYHFLGLVSEIGELSEHLTSSDPGTKVILEAAATLGRASAVKKRDIRDNGRVIQYSIIGKGNDIESELGDILWYVSQLISACKYSMSSIMQLNLQKLRDRASRNVIRGKGDHR